VHSVSELVQGGWSETQLVIAANVRAETARRGWTQRDLAVKTGMTESKTSRLLHGKADWWLADLHRISKAFECQITEFFPKEMK
jgi:transcriptional regulator with XRE-family HTH domain